MVTLRIRRRVLVAVCTIAALVLTLAASASASCPGVAIYGVRGSGEDYARSELGMGAAVHAIANRIYVPSGVWVVQVGVPYAAVNVFFGATTGAGKGPYNASVVQGADLLADGRSGFTGIADLVHRCPHVQLVLAGFSQGAQVITTALAQAPRPTVVTRRIRAVLLFGNPVRTPNQPYDVGSNAHSGILSAARLQPGGVAAVLPRHLWPVTRSYCLAHDPVCAFSPADLALHRDVHGTYAGSAFAQAAADFATAALGYRRPTGATVASGATVGTGATVGGGTTSPPGPRWYPPAALGTMGALGSDPAVAVWPGGTRNPPGQQDVFWKGAGNAALWEAVWNNGWHGPSPVPGTGNVAGAPTAAINAPRNEEDIFWAASDANLWEIEWAGAWTAPHVVPGMGPLGSSPSLAVWPGGTRKTPGEQDVFWKGAGNNGLWEAVWNNGWHGPSPVPGVNNVAGAPSAIVNAARNEEDIFWAGTDGNLWEIEWAGAWTAPHVVAGMGPLGSNPSVAVWPSGQQDVFWKGAGNSGVWEAVWNNGWHGPSPVPGVGTARGAPTAVVNAPRNEEDVFWAGADPSQTLWQVLWGG
jgi:hypothetical protein